MDRLIQPNRNPEVPEGMPGPFGDGINVNRDAMAVVAPEVDDSMLDDADRLLQPLWQLLDPMLYAEELGGPLIGFDPLRGKGGGSGRELQLPTLPEGVGRAAVEVPSASELPWLSATQLAELVRSGMVTPLEVVNAFAERIERIDPVLNAFITSTVDGARASADQELSGRLASVPIGLKDLFDTAGVRCTSGSRLSDARLPTEDALAWARMRKEGCLLLGKLNTQEFAAGVTSENDHFGAVRNPWDITKISGGSSGGSAAAVASALVSLSLGTDTGGSVRLPASYCGVVGFKPTFGLAPVSGVQPLAWSLDHVGPIARTVRDAAACLDVVAMTHCEEAALSGAVHGLRGIRVAIPRDWVAVADESIQKGFAAALSVLESCGATLVDAPSLPDLDVLAALNRVIAYAEGSCVHEPRLRLGFKFGSLVHARMVAGLFITAGQYLAAQRLRRRVCEQIANAWSVGDVLAMPTVSCSPPPIGSSTVSVGGQYGPIGTELVKFTAPFNLTGSPALTVPCGWDSVDLPVGLQIVGTPGADRLVCFAAAAYEAHRDACIGTRRPVPRTEGEGPEYR